MNWNPLFYLTLTVYQHKIHMLLFNIKFFRLTIKLKTSE